MPEALMQELCERLDRFNEHWPKFVIEAVAYRVELYEDGKVPDVIKPIEIHGAQAIEECKRAFRAFSRIPELQHPGSVFRLPGYIALDRLLLDEIDAINNVKQNLKDSIYRLHPSGRSRNVYCRRTFQGRMMLQAYRKLYSARSPLKGVRFTWSPRTYSVKRITKGQALEQLRKRLEYAEDGTSVIPSVQKAVEDVKALRQSIQIVIERPRAPYPIASLIHEFGKDGIRKMIPMSLPIFLGPGVNGEPLDIGSLASHSGKQRRKKRSDRKRTKSLYKPLYMSYRV